MAEIQVMLVDNNLNALNRLAVELSEECAIKIIAIATNGRDALDILRTITPDIIVSDIVMPMVDGFGLLEEIKSAKRTNAPKVIVLTHLTADRFIMRAMELGAYYYMCKPYDSKILCQRIRESQEYAQPSIDVESMEAPATLKDEIKELLDRQGISNRITGYNYLHSAIKIGLTIDAPLSGRITKELYPAIAEIYGTTTDKVERSIRTTIEKGWIAGGIRTGNSFPAQKRPTNGEYIANMVRIMSMQQRTKEENGSRLLN